MKNKLTLKELTVGLVNHCYRNLPVVEDSHATTNFHMSMEYYVEVYEEVNKKIVHLLDNINIVLMLMDKGLTEEVLSLDYDRRRLIGEIFLFSLGAISWYDPVLLDDVIGNDYTAYLLAGEFMNHCRNNMTMSDKDMMEMNIDITNRMYSLLCKEVLRSF